MKNCWAISLAWSEWPTASNSFVASFPDWASSCSAAHGAWEEEEEEEEEREEEEREKKQSRG